MVNKNTLCYKAISGRNEVLAMVCNNKRNNYKWSLSRLKTSEGVFYGFDIVIGKITGIKDNISVCATREDWLLAIKHVAKSYAILEGLSEKVAINKRVKEITREVVTEISAYFKDHPKKFGGDIKPRNTK